MTELEQLVREGAKKNTAVWLETYGKIQNSVGAITDATANEFQKKVCDIIEWCLENGKPCRIVILKPRQRGSSTISVASGYRFLQNRGGRGLIAGGSAKQTTNLFRMLNVYATKDELNPNSCVVLADEARFGNGAVMDKITLASKNAGRSGTWQFMVITEVAYLASEGVVNATDALDGLLKCVPYKPGTIIIQESTANGAHGEFFNTFQGGITFEEAKAGKNGYIKVFAAWHEFADLRMPPESEGIYSTSDYTKKEQDLAERWDLDMEQIAWMRWAIKDECRGDFSKFEQDYPFDSDSCFLKSGQGVFDLEGLEHQSHLIRIQNGFSVDYGYVDYNDSNKRALFKPCDESMAKAIRYEKPKVGCRYILACDPMTGASQVGGTDPDSHAVFVMRAGYIDGATGRWVEPAVVMRNILYHDGMRFGNWWEIDFLTDELYAMSKYYGGCPIVVEMEKDRGIVELLKLKPDANIYRRKILNQRENKETEAYGWSTNERTRGMLVTAIAASIRKAGHGEIGEGVEVRSENTLKQLKNFVRKMNGRTEAAEGHHDDDVLCLGIALYCLPAATGYAEQTRPPWIPPDLRGPDYGTEISNGQYT